MSEGNAKYEAECDHKWGITKRESRGVGSGIFSGTERFDSERKCFKCGAEQVMIDAGGNGEWIDKPKSEIPVHMLFGYPTEEEYKAGNLTADHEKNLKDYVTKIQSMMKSGSAAVDMGKARCNDVKIINGIVKYCLECESNACPKRRTLVKDLIDLSSSLYSRVIEGEIEISRQLSEEATK